MIDESYGGVDNSDYLEHYGKLLQKWGQRKYQNKDGTLTPLGKKHYAEMRAAAAKTAAKEGTDLELDLKKQSNNGDNGHIKVVSAVDEAKQHIQNSKSAAMLFANSNLYSNKELKDAYDRMKLETDIKELANKQSNMYKTKNKGEKFLQDAHNKINTLSSAYNDVQNVMKMYNGVSRMVKKKNN